MGVSSDRVLSGTDVYGTVSQREEGRATAATAGTGTVGVTVVDAWREVSRCGGDGQD